MDLPTQTIRLEPWWVGLQLASIFASVFFEGIYCGFNNITCWLLFDLIGSVRKSDGQDEQSLFIVYGDDLGAVAEAGFQD